MKTFNEVWASRLDEKDIKPGTVIYPVFSWTGSVAERTSAQVIDSGVYTESYGKNNLFLGDKFFDTINGCLVQSLAEGNVKQAVEQKQQTFRALFLTEEDADAYVAYINNDMLPDEFRALRNKFVDRQQKMRESSDDSWN